MTLSPNGNDTKITCRKLTLIENKSLRLLIEVSIFLSTYYIHTEPVFVFFLSFQNDVFITVLWKFLMTAQCKILMTKIIRTAYEINDLNLPKGLVQFSWVLWIITMMLIA